MVYTEKETKINDFLLIEKGYLYGHLLEKYGISRNKLRYIYRPIINIGEFKDGEYIPSEYFQEAIGYLLTDKLKTDMFFSEFLKFIKQQIYEQELTFINIHEDSQGNKYFISQLSFLSLEWLMLIAIYGSEYMNTKFNVIVKSCSEIFNPEIHQIIFKNIEYVYGVLK